MRAIVPFPTRTAQCCVLNSAHSVEQGRGELRILPEVLVVHTLAISVVRDLDVYITMSFASMPECVTSHSSLCITQPGLRPTSAVVSIRVNSHDPTTPFAH